MNIPGIKYLLSRYIGDTTPPNNTGSTESTLSQKVQLFNPSLAYKAATSIPPIWYYDPEIYTTEKKVVFSKNWISVGSTDKVAAPLSYFELQVGDEPVAVVRGADETLRAMANICRHRAYTPLTGSQGTLADDKIQCTYHGWCYDTAGKLCSAPKLSPEKGFSRDNHSLGQFEIDTWGPLVFIRMQKGEERLATILEPLIEKTKHTNIDSLKFAGRQEYKMDCNWKVFIDNYLDGGYHIATGHPELNQAVDYSQYRTEAFDFSSVQTCPTQTIDDPSAALRPEGTAMYWWIYPNTMINIYEGIMDVNIVIPTGVDKCKVIFDYYFDDSFEQAAIQRYMNEARVVQGQDMDLCMRVQRGLKSQFAKPGLYAKPEIGQHHFHKLLAQDLQEAL